MATFQQQLHTLITTVEAKKRSLDEIITVLRKVEMEFNGQPMITLDALRQEAAIRGGDGSQATYFERIAQYFVDHDNQPKTIKEITEGIDGNKPSIANVVYTTHKKLFVSQAVSGKRHQVAWTMTPEAFQEFALRRSV